MDKADDEGGEELWSEEELKRPPRSVADSVRARMAEMEQQRQAMHEEAANGAEAKRPGGDKAGEPFTPGEMRKRLEK